MQIQSPLPCVTGNAAALTQCFSNLLGNAVKFVAPGVVPQVVVRAEEKSDGLARIWVEDNGIGIAKAAHSRIFAMFERLHTAYEGTGIGLALVRKVVKRMNGDVGVESELGKGSRFWVEFQRAR
ncbi:MAG: ATP-binding protein [Verrucomicrobiota bacterium]